MKFIRTVRTLFSNSCGNENVNMFDCDIGHAPAYKLR